MCPPYIPHGWPASQCLAYLAGGGLVSGLQLLRKLAGTVTGCQDRESTTNTVIWQRSHKLQSRDRLETLMRLSSTPHGKTTELSRSACACQHGTDNNRAGTGRRLTSQAPPSFLYVHIGIKDPSNGDHKNSSESCPTLNFKFPPHVFCKAPFTCIPLTFSFQLALTQLCPIDHLSFRS